MRVTLTQQQWTLNEFAQSLEQRLDGVMRGQVLLQDLPPAVSAWFYAGEAYGRASQQTEIDRLERDNNRLYNLAFTTDKQRRELLNTRLTAALENATEDQWKQLDKDLAAMAGTTSTENTNTIDPAHLAEIEGTHGRSSGTTRPEQQAA